MRVRGYLAQVRCTKNKGTYEAAAAAILLTALAVYGHDLIITDIASFSPRLGQLALRLIDTDVGELDRIYFS